MYRKNHIKNNLTISSFYWNIDLNLIKKWLLIVKKWESQVIITMIMLTRSSERIFNPSRYTGAVTVGTFQTRKTTAIRRIAVPPKTPCTSQHYRIEWFNPHYAVRRQSGSIWTERITKIVHLILFSLIRIRLTLCTLFYHKIFQLYICVFLI